ncbi:respiratory nitrate reductase subunit gamma [Frigidibacter sp. SD6-1]|uniref:respiratory nitrate reductase subunit gamma n=1 Tax=Frigidibacter sp. SD6-1 TaxID=3032581 RepID=UPI0024DFE643|nr:respiratory nitrate reductase subunit gamma [Frigidibacter sp. SD6-1]
MHHFLYGIYPYIALSVMVIASAARYDRDPFTWKSKSSQLLRRRSFVIGSVLFHVGVLLIFAGHLIGLLTPIWIFDSLGIPHGAKQLLAMAAGGIAGVMALIGGFILLARRLFDPRISANSTVADTGILILLVAQLLLGVGSIFVSVQHLDGHEMVKFMSWAQGILTFDPKAASYIADVNWIFKAHIALGLTIFLLFPFTRLVHIVSAPVRFLWRPGYQIVRTRKETPAE